MQAWAGTGKRRALQEGWLTVMPIMGMIMPTLGSQLSPRKPRRKSLADALFTKTQQRVLGVLFGQPERSFYASELIRHAGTGSGAAQRELAKLEESGLIVTRRIGHQKHYQANAASPLFSELRNIVLKTVSRGAAARCPEAVVVGRRQRATCRAGTKGCRED